MKVCVQEVSWGVLLESKPGKEWRKYNWAERRLKLWCHQNKGFCWPTGNPGTQICPEFRVKGQDFIPIQQYHWMWLSPRSKCSPWRKCSSLQVRAITGRGYLAVSIELSTLTAGSRVRASVLKREIWVAQQCSLQISWLELTCITSHIAVVRSSHMSPASSEELGECCLQQCCSK